MIRIMQNILILLGNFNQNKMNITQMRREKQTNNIARKITRDKVENISYSMFLQSLIFC